MPRVARFAWLVLAYNVAVILWGAYVRATGSGAGCGEHWPLCNGTVLPRDPSVETIIEFSHRLTSGLALVGVLALLVWTFRARPSGHQARTWAVLSFVFILTEAAVGAGLVLFQLVADNASMARGLFMAVHLMNTFILLACLAMTAWTLTAGLRVETAGKGPAVAVVGAGLFALILAGTSGAVAALGDTLFPSSSLAEALTADLSATSHLLVRLRVLHPVLALIAGASILVLAPRLARTGGPNAMIVARAVAALVALQFVAGFVNVILLAPVWLQMVHLLLADGIWIGFVVLAADSLASHPSVAAAHAA